MQINLKLSTSFKVLFLAVFFTSCLTNVEEEIVIEDTCETTSYSLNVQPIISNNCTQCHSTNGGQFPNLESYNGVSANANKVLAEVESRRMPIGGSLTSAEIEAIKCWVNNGALNN